MSVTEEVQYLPSRLLSKAELAGLLGCSAATLHRRYRAGLLPPAVKMGNQIKWTRIAVERWFEAGCPPQDAPK